jgi:hypothetical protein
MKRLVLTLILLTGLVACDPPAVIPESSRQGDIVTVTMTVTEPFYLTSLVLSSDVPLSASQVSDPRCADGPAVDGLIPFVMCDLGGLKMGESVSIGVLSESPIYCLAGGYESASAVSYRTIPCAVSD